MIKDVMELIVFIIYMYYLVLKIKIINRIRLLCVYVRECGFVFMLIICWYFVGNCLYRFCIKMVCK